tara:strand:+ start:3582 stop:4862 length:1281 start_codon:yes stop_codon:yes gene_type:complete
MIIHKKLLNQFYKIEKKFFNDPSYNISKNYLHTLLLNKNFNFIRISFLGLILNFILLSLSLFTIFLCKIKRIKHANYFIVHRGQKGKFDFRSNFILENYEFKKSLNIIRCSSFLDSLKAYFTYPNVIFYLSFDYFHNDFFYTKSSLIKNYKILHKKEKKNYQMIKKIFKFLRIKKFLSIDDQRVIQSFLKACNDLRIESFGYMHYKFSKYVVGIKYLCFDNFIVWSNYFKKKLIEVNEHYSKKKIFISGYPQKKISKKRNKNLINILYLYDLNLNFKKVCDLLKKLNSNKKINIYVKLKPQRMETRWINFCKKENIRYFQYKNLDQINREIKFNYFIATISTAILEATLYKAIPLKLNSINDFADDLVQDEVVFKVNKYQDIIKISQNKLKKNDLSRIFRKVWGLKKYNSNNIKKYLLNYFYRIKS